MPHYILSGRTARGGTQTQLLQADSAADAIAAFRQAGHVDIVLHTDEVMAEGLDPSVFQNGVTPQQWLDFGRTPNTFATRFRQMLRSSFFPWLKRGLLTSLVLLVLDLAGFQWFVGIPGLDRPGLQRRVSLFLFAFAIAAVSLAISRKKSNLYDRLIAAAAWGRHAEVMALVPRVRKAVADVKMAREDVIIREAVALAALGRMDEALQIVESASDSMPPWLFWARISEVFSAAGRQKEQLAAMERSVELAPENATCLIDLALTLTRMRRDVPRARALLGQALQLPASEFIQPFVTMADGMITLEEGQPRRAAELLSRSIEEMRPMAEANALAELGRDRTRAYLALACNATGEHDLALQNFRQAEPRLNAISSMHELRDRCLKELRCTPAV